MIISRVTSKISCYSPIVTFVSVAAFYLHWLWLCTRQVLNHHSQQTRSGHVLQSEGSLLTSRNQPTSNSGNVMEGRGNVKLTFQVVREYNNDNPLSPLMLNVPLHSVYSIGNRTFQLCLDTHHVPYPCFPVCWYLLYHLLSHISSTQMHPLLYLVNPFNNNNYNTWHLYSTLSSPKVLYSIIIPDSDLFQPSAHLNSQGSLSHMLPL